MRVRPHVQEVAQESELFFEAEKLFLACGAHAEFLFARDAVHAVLDQVTRRRLHVALGLGV